MPLSDLNALFAAPWPRFQETVKSHLEASLKGGWELTQIDIAAPFGYTVLSTTEMEVAIPLDPAGWSLTLQKNLPVGQVVVHVDTFRLVIRVPLDDTDPDRPRVVTEGVEIVPEVSIRVPGVFPASIAINAFEKQLDADGNAVYAAAVDRPASGGSAFSLTGTLRLYLFPVASFRFQGRMHTPCHTGPVDWDQNLPVSPETQQLIKVASQYGLPREWGNAPPPPLPPIPAGTDFRGKALEMENSVLAHMGYEPPLPNAPFRLLGSVFDNTYDIPKPLGNAVPQLQYFSGEPDSSIWTGHYLAAECFRYGAATTPADKQEALDRVLLVLGAVETLFRFTAAATGGRLKGLLCRAALPKVGQHTIPTFPPLDQPDDPSKYYPKTALDGLDWYALGLGAATPSRDQYLGVVLGLAAALRLVRDDAGVQERAKSLATDIVSYLTDNGWNVPIPLRDDLTKTEIRTTYIHEFHQQIGILRLGATANPQKFEAMYQAASRAADLMWTTVWGSCLEPVESYYKFNLDHGFMAVLFLLETEAALKQQFMRALRMLRRTVGHHRNAYFNLVWILADPAHASQKAGSTLDQPGDAGDTVAEETRSLLLEWLNRRDAVAGRNDLPRKETPDQGYLRSLYPGDVREYVPGGGEWLSAYPLPVDKRTGKDMDFLWQRDPFKTNITVVNDAVTAVDQGEPNVEAPGVDFLLAYWMAAHLGIAA